MPIDTAAAPGLLLTLGLMSIGILSIACMPGYATIGLLAPLIVLAGRLIQGFSAGMELGGVSVYLAEIATPGRKGFYVSWQSASQQAAVMFAALLGVVLTRPAQPGIDGGVGLARAAAHRLRDHAVPVLAPRARSTRPTSSCARRHQPDTRGILRSLAANCAARRSSARCSSR